MENEYNQSNKKNNPHNPGILNGEWDIPALIDCFCQDYNKTKKQRLIQVLDNDQILAQIRIGRNGGDGCFVYLSSPIIDDKIALLKKTAKDLNKYVKNKKDGEDLIELAQEAAIDTVKPLIYKLSEKEYCFQLIAIDSAEDEKLIDKLGLTEIQSIKFSEKNFIRIRNRVIGELEEKAKKLVNIHSDKIDQIYSLIPYKYKLPKI